MPNATDPYDDLISDRVAELRRREKEHLALLREIRDMVHGAIARAEAEEAGKGGA